MKNIYLSLLLIFVFSFSLSAQIIPNRGFENWSNQVLSETADHWNTGDFMLIANGNPPATTKSTDHAFGNYSMKLSCYLTAQGDTAMGYGINSGTVQGDTSGLAYSRGFPFNDSPDSIYAWFKPQLQANDSAWFIVTFKQGGLVLSENFFLISGNQAGFSRWGFDLATMGSAPDTCIIGMTASNPNLGRPGSIVYADQISFSGITDSIPNAGFEYWSVQNLLEPDEWTTVNVFNATEGSNPSAVPDTIRHSGNFSARFETVQFNLFGGSKSGYLTTGDHPGNNGVTGGFPFSGNPGKLSGWYKYTPQGMDTAAIYLIMSHYDATNDSTIFIGMNMYDLPAVANFTYFEMTPTWNTSLTIDTVNIFFVASKNIFGGDTALVHAGSRLWLDDLWLSNECNYLDTTSSFISSDSTCDYWVLTGRAGFSGYVWSTGDNDAVDTVMASGTYFLTVTDTAGCTKTDSITVVVTPCIGIQSVEIENKIKIFPNPFNSKLTIILDPSQKKSGIISLWDVNGRIIFEKITSGNPDYEFDLSTIPNGIYVLRFDSDSKTVSRRIIKQ